MPKINTSPLISIIIRTQNRCTLLSQALQSLISQTYTHLEIIIVNDGGESCEAVLQQFQSQLTIQMISIPQSKGRSHAANLGLQTVSGKYINFLDDDDILYPDHIEKLVTFLELTGEKVAYSDCEIGHYHFVLGEGFVLQREKYIFKGVDFNQNQLYFENYLPIMTVMFQHDLAVINGGFDESLEVFEDWDYWIRLSQISNFQRVQGITCEYRFFSDYNYDFQYWRNVIYQKYADYWTMERFYQTAWEYINQLDIAKAHLQNKLKHMQERLQKLSSNNDELKDTVRIQTTHLNSLNQTQKSLQETQKIYKEAQSQLNIQETHIEQLTTQLEEHIRQMQQIKSHNHHLEKHVNEPGCIIGLYRSLIPLTIRLRLHDLRQAIISK